MNRRSFIKNGCFSLLTTFPFLNYLTLSSNYELNNSSMFSNKYNIDKLDSLVNSDNNLNTTRTHTNNLSTQCGQIFPDKVIFPAALKPDDTVAFTAPASPISIGKIKEYVKFFKSKGCNILIGDTIKKQNNLHKYFSAEDSVRAAEFNQFIQDENVKAIICGRGGYGVMRILPMLDYATLAKNPKFIMGYSDITALLLAVYKKSNIAAFHGPVGSSKITTEHKINIENIYFNYNQNSYNSLKNEIKNNHSNILINYKIKEMKFIDNLTDKEFSGRLQGGNLTLISATMGTEYEIDLTDAIFFFEDTNVLAHNVDRMLANLFIANKLKSCRGFIVGKMKGFEKRGNFYPNKAFTIKEVIEDFANQLKIPYVYNIPFGHVASEIIFPLGIEATVDINNKQISLMV